MESTQTGVWLANTAVRVADACFSLGGGSALYETSPLQRRMRDMHAAAQHAAVQQRHNVSAGKLFLAEAKCIRMSGGSQIAATAVLDAING